MRYRLFRVVFGVLWALLLLSGLEVHGQVPADAYGGGGLERCKQNPEVRGQVASVQLRALSAQPVVRVTEAPPEWLAQDLQALFKVVVLPESRELSLQVLSSQLPNAYATLDGSIFVTAGLLSESGLTRDELTAVLAHEVAHLVLRDAVAAHCAAMLGYGHDGRTAELEADQLALRILAAAGRPTVSLRSALGKLSRSEERDGASGTHPATRARMQMLYRSRGLGG